MIQRIQTLFLALGVGCLGTILGLQQNVTEADPTPPPTWFSPALLGLTILALVVAAIAIFLFRDRKRQIKLVLYVMLMTLVLIAVVVGGLYMMGQLDDFVRGQTEIADSVVVVMPFLAYVFFSLARRGIHRDIKLIQSMDRLR